MAIPKIEFPTYELELKSIGKTIKFRPFLVKEEKLLLIASESGDASTIMNSVTQVIQNCVLDPIDVSTLPIFEMEYLFLNLRARSVGEHIDITYVCQNDFADKKCFNDNTITVNLLEVKLSNDEINPVIKITDTVGAKLKYPTMKISNRVNSEPDINKHADMIIEDCIDYLFDEDQTYKVSEMQDGEFESFLNNLSEKQYALIKGYVDNIPTVKYETTSVCSKCTKEHRIKLEGILDFFV